MPEVVIGQVVVRKVVGTVDVVGRGEHYVTVFLDEDRAYAEVETPDGQNLETEVAGQLLNSGTGASGLLQHAVRRALVGEE